MTSSASSNSELNLELLCSLIKTPSNISEASIGVDLVKVLADYGFSVERQEVETGRWNLFATKNLSSNTKAVLFYAHQDTVSPLPDWKDPFSPIIQGDTLIGLGSYDMKGGLVAILDASKDTHAYVKLFLAIDEENISSGAWHAIEHNRPFFEDVELVISAEPNFGLGLEGITRGRTGRAIFVVDFQGKAAHVAKYRDAVDAIELASSWVNTFYQRRDTLFSSAKTVGLVRKFIGEAVGMSVCSSVQLEVEVQVGASDSFERVKVIIESIEPNNERIAIELKPRPTPYLPGYFFESFPHQEKIAEIISEATGKNMKLCERSSVGDDNAMATLGIPVITWGPDGGNAHNTGEWVSLYSLRKLSGMFKQLLRYC